MRRTFTVVTALAILAAACAGGSTGDTGDSRTTTTAAGRPAGAPARIVSLSPTATEMLFAIGAGDQVVAVDDQSDFPPGVPGTDLSGLTPNVEAIATYEPDLVVLAGDDAVAGLEALGIETIVNDGADTLDDSYAQIAELGIVTGHEEEAAEVVAGMRTGLEELASVAPDRDEPLTYYHELDDTLYSVTSDTFIGEIYALAGLTSIADAADPDGALGGFPQLSPELVVEADPDFVFLADTECCAQTAETFAARPGFSALTAVQEGRVVELDDDVASRWGPRVVDFLARVVEATATVPAG
ncbi:MAG TPA: ABC transporter substrate-binding protein [Acidimicrobiales bacterium]|nr:ABC transporter substrate-binding protein [Acidimicrobiales bacterium]